MLLGESKFWLIVFLDNQPHYRYIVLFFIPEVEVFCFCFFSHPSCTGMSVLVAFSSLPQGSLQLFFCRGDAGEESGQNFKASWQWLPFHSPSLYPGAAFPCFSPVPLGQCRCARMTSRPLSGSQDSLVLFAHRWPQPVNSPVVLADSFFLGHV